jgi:hypothetical protein
VSYEYFCPGGTVFDIRFNVCNYPHDVPVSWKNIENLSIGFQDFHHFFLHTGIIAHSTSFHILSDLCKVRSLPSVDSNATWSATRIKDAYRILRGAVTVTVIESMSNFPALFSQECYGTTKPTTTPTGTTTTPLSTTTTTTPLSTTTSYYPLPPSVICHRIGLNPNPYVTLKKHFCLTFTYFYKTPT